MGGKVPGHAHDCLFDGPYDSPDIVRLNSCLCTIRHGEVVEICPYNLGALILFPVFGLC